MRLAVLIGLLLLANAGVARAQDGLETALETADSARAAYRGGDPQLALELLGWILRRTDLSPRAREVLQERQARWTRAAEALRQARAAEADLSRVWGEIARARGRPVRKSKGPPREAPPELVARELAARGEAIAAWQEAMRLAGDGLPRLTAAEQIRRLMPLDLPPPAARCPAPARGVPRQVDWLWQLELPGPHNDEGAFARVLAVFPTPDERPTGPRVRNPDAPRVERGYGWFAGDAERPAGYYVWSATPRPAWYCWRSRATRPVVREAPLDDRGFPLEPVQPARRSLCDVLGVPCEPVPPSVSSPERNGGR